MGKYSTPKRGSLQFHPRSRAKSEIPRIRTWVPKEGAKLLGFAGYKVGLTHVTFIENNPNLGARVGQEKRLAVTVLEVPPLKAIGYRMYKGARALGDVLAKELPKELSRRISLPKKPQQPNGAAADSVRLLVSTQPVHAGLPKKKPEIIEIALQGSPAEQMKIANEHLGKDVKFSEVFKKGDYVDVISVTTGKGFQGPVKRHGVKIRPHKAKRGLRKPANIGSWTPKRVDWRAPMAGQMGYNQRCEYNKRIVLLGEGGLNPADGGWRGYGKLDGDYIFLAGSVPGPTKRLIRMRFPIRPPSKVFDVPSIEYSAVQKVSGESR